MTQSAVAAPSFEPLSDALRERVLERTRELVERANAHFGLALPVPRVDFDINGVAWGYYVRHGTRVRIRFNPVLFERAFAESLNDTVPHEVAHYVVDHAFSRRAKPHGSEWQRVMRLFGVDKPKATARYDTEGLSVRRQRRFAYRCDCREHEITTTRHRRALRGVRYVCRECQAALRPI